MKKILVAEDDKFLEDAYRLKLEKAGFELRMAGDGDEVLKILHEFTPDLILLDLMMPNKDGFAALEELRKNPLWKGIPVLVASNLGQMDDIDRAMKLGATDYVIKSDLTMAGLLDKINKYLAV